MKLTEIIPVGQKLSKERISEIAREWVEKFSTHPVPAGAYVVLQAIIKAAQEACKDPEFVAAYMEDAINHGKNTAYGVGFTMVSGRASYDFSTCEKWRELVAERDGISKRIAALEKQLKAAADAGIEYIDPDSGECCDIQKSVGDKSLRLSFPND